ncbi:OmpA family protein [Flavobacterium sp. MC2016-06]|jgi:OOP family OmpA-OmpF porin|uniref:OmpA family protein n=1 Tax=Flavobacterium sp. MC2016-06 TaxID=2676308 RepID=UPI0012BB093A|nr:OmpA family protein [Flavobacterium sp. MC2016-06]MBU3862138.1 OmpA family protein [Flavobacterium sp. MC2016-06]
MKKVVAVLAITMSLSGLHAQEKTEKQSDQFNKWSVEFGGGFNKPERPISNESFTRNVSPFTADLGVRYMFNNKFGLKADFGYNSFTANTSNGSKDFDSKYYRVDLQGVANLGRIMNFETWTNTIGLLGHAGVGLGRLDNKAMSNDRVGNFIAGITGQIRLSDRIALTGDFTTILNATQDTSFDGQFINNYTGFSGVVFNGTVGLNVYLGKNTKHADWVVMSNNTDLSALENKLANLETQLKNIPEQKQVVVEKQPTTPVPTDNELIKKMINDKYFSVYFDFNKATPQETSTAAMDVVLTYLRNVPSSTVDLLGYADQVGNSEYNEKLSNTRANNVKTILEKAGISSSRISVLPKGADTTIAKDSEEARRLARRVTFKVK